VKKNHRSLKKIEHYMYKNLTVENSSWLKRFSHKTRYEVAINVLDINVKDNYLDYGTGDGFLLLKINDKHPDIKITGFEPVESQFNELSV
jgi:tRNA G46 methylase TrmB